MKIETINFKDTEYKILSLERHHQDPTLFTFIDEESVRVRDWNIEENDFIIDIGSGFGSYVLPALAKGACYAICINYNSEENSILKSNLELNGWENKVSIIEKGIYSKSGWLRDLDQTFKDQKDESVGDDFFKVFSFQDLIDESQICKYNNIWVKIDIEGAEVEVVKGMGEFVKKYSPTILVENHQFKDISIDGRVEAILREYGYQKISCYPYHGVSHAVYKPAAGG